MTNSHVAEALLRGKFLINFNNLIAWPARTGIQRVCYEFCSRWPHIQDTIPFVELGMDRIGILDPAFFESVRQVFEETDDVLKALSEEFDDLKIDTSPGTIGLFSARNRIILEVPVVEALEHCRAVLSLEESLNLEFYSLAAATRPEKIFNLCHDFLSWTHSEFFSTDWKSADNICHSISNRRKYTHNIFTSTSTRDVYVNRINRGDRRPYLVIPPGADGLGRTFRQECPQTNEFLVVGTLEPRKQTVHILRAFERLQAEGHDVRLCFAGRMGWLEPADKAELEAAFKHHSWLRWVDGPADDELRDLMLNCRATIYMSLAEGFGSPPVESLALGAPCIVSANLPSLLDMESNGQVRIDPNDIEALMGAVRRLLDDQAVSDLQVEIETLELPTWQTFVDGIAKLVEEKAPELVEDSPGSSYRARLDIITSLSLMRQISRAELVERLVMSAHPGVSDRELAQWQIHAKRANWSNVEVVLNLMRAFPDAIPPGLVNEAVAQRLKVDYVPPKFAQEWQARFRRLMQIPYFPDFFEEAVYQDILERDPGPGEVMDHIPSDEREILRTSALRSAINSQEYHDRLASGVRNKSDEGYFDSISLPTIGWKNRILDHLDSEAAVQRALLFEDDDGFLEAANLDLAGHLPSRTVQTNSRAILRTRHGRDRALLRLLLSEACLRRVKDPEAHLLLIHKLAARAGLAKRRPDNAHEIAGKVNAVLALPDHKMSDGFAIFFGRNGSEEEQSLSDLADGSAHVLASCFVVLGTMQGDLAVSPLFVSWAVNTLLDHRRSTRVRQHSRAVGDISADLQFERLFSRVPNGREAAIMTRAASNGMTDPEIADAVRVAAIRKGAAADLASQIMHFAQCHERWEKKFNRIEMLAEELLEAAPAPGTKPWRRPLAPADRGMQSDGIVHQLADSARTVSHRGGGEVVTVDQLMAEEGEDFVRAAYRKLLQREPDDGGMQTYLNSLRSGRSKAAVIYSLSTSSEGKAADVNLVGLEGLLVRQRRMRRWHVRKILQVAGIQL